MGLLISALAALMMQAAASGGTNISPAASSRGDAMTGTATIRCKVNKDGTLTACRVLAEDPKAKGLGDAALAMGKLTRLPPDVVAHLKKSSSYFDTRIVFKGGGTGSTAAASAKSQLTPPAVNGGGIFRLAVQSDLSSVEFADADQIQRQGDIHSMPVYWVWADWRAPKPKAATAIISERYDCTKRTSETTQLTFYDETGNVVSSAKGDGAVVAVAPNSVSEAELNFACEDPSHHDPSLRTSVTDTRDLLKYGRGLLKFVSERQRAQ